MKKPRWNILLEDEHLIIIDKPANYLTTPDRYNGDIPNLISSLKEHRPEVFLNHRIDKETSGLILFSKSENCHKLLSSDLENQKINKQFQTITNGQPPLDIGLIELPLSKSQNPRKGIVINPQGKPAATKYRTLEAFKNYAYVELKLITHHTHQIRTHLKAIHSPIICDPMYGDGQPFLLSSIKRKFKRSTSEEKPLISRIALHASLLEFTHPITKENIKIESPLPKDMRATLNQLRKNNVG